MPGGSNKPINQIGESHISLKLTFYPGWFASLYPISLLEWPCFMSRDFKTNLLLVSVRTPTAALRRVRDASLAHWPPANPIVFAFKELRSGYRGGRRHTIFSGCDETISLTHFCKICKYLRERVVHLFGAKQLSGGQKTSPGEQYIHSLYLLF